jgi:hypothetical protein
MVVGEHSQRTDGIPVAEVAQMFGVNIDTMRKRIETAGLDTYTIGRARYVVQPDQWPVQWGEPLREPSGTALAPIPETSGMPAPAVVAGFVAQLSERDQRIGKVEEQLRAKTREVTRLRAQVDALNDQLVDLRLTIAELKGQH